MTKAAEKTEDVSLVRTLSNKDVLALGFGAMIGFGWVVLTKGWLLDAGPGGAALAFLVGGIIMALVGLVYAELTSAMPKAGGAHNFILRARGPRGAFIGSWGFIGGYVTIIAFEAVAVPNTVEYIWPDINHIPLWTIAGFEVNLTWALIGVVTAIVLTWINVRGTKIAGMVQTFVVLFLLLVGLMLITGAFTGGEARNLEPMFTPGVGGFFAVMIAVPFLFVGFVSSVAPFFGTALLDWMVESGSPMIVITYMLVSVSFLILRRREPNMSRPLRVGGVGRGGEVIGWFAIVLTVALLAQYLPGMPAQLGWQPWVIFGAWWLAGAVFYFRLPKGIRGGDDVEERLSRAMQARERQRITSAKVEIH